MTDSVDGLPLPRRYWAIAAIALGIAMALMDANIANVALPTIATDLHADASYSVWVINAYQLAMIIALLPLAAFGDIIGHRRVFLAGLVLFTASSFACSVSHTLAALAFSRVTQGFGAAGIQSVNLALVRFVYPRRFLGRGIGINALVIAVAAAAGPTLASGILSVATWPWLFAINIPIGIVACLISMYALPKTPRAPHELDLWGAALSAAAFGLLIGGIDAASHGEGSLAFAGEMIVAAVLGTLLVRRELARPARLVPVDLLGIPVFALSIIASILAFIAQMLAFVALPFYLQREFGYSAVETGLLITPWPLGVAVAAPVSGRLADRWSVGLFDALGLVVMTGGLLALAVVPVRPGFVDVAWRVALCGIGFGLFLSPNNHAIIAATPRERTGGASGMLGSARLLGQSIGAALVALLLLRIPGEATTAALFLAAGLSVAGALMSASKLLAASPGPHYPTLAERDRQSAPE